jgi:hypothetical protein
MLTVLSLHCFAASDILHQRIAASTADDPTGLNIFFLHSSGSERSEQLPVAQHSLAAGHSVPASDHSLLAAESGSAGCRSTASASSFAAR